MFAVIDGVLLTPPADGRLLPGTTRAAVLRAAHSRGIRVGQKPLTLDELAEATEVFVTNAVAGLIPVTAIEGSRLAWPPGPVAAALAAALAARPPDAPAAGPVAHPPSAPSQPVTSSSPAARSPERTRIGPGFPRYGSIGPGIPRAINDMVRGSPGPERGAARPLVILVDNYDSFTWNLAHLLDTAGARVEVVRNDEVTAGQVVAAAPAGVVISPGPCAPAEAGISVATVTACAAAGVPLLGICLGHQAIGAAFGADIIAAPRPVHGTAFPVTHDGAGVFRGLPSPFQATRYHSLIVDEATLPPDLLVTARTDGIPMAVRHATRPVEGVQFHPESILTTHGAAIIANFVGTAARASAGHRSERQRRSPSAAVRRAVHSNEPRGHVCGLAGMARPPRRSITIDAMSELTSWIRRAWQHGLADGREPARRRIRADRAGRRRGQAGPVRRRPPGRRRRRRAGRLRGRGHRGHHAAGRRRSSPTPCSSWGIGAALRPGSLVVEMSSADPADTLRTAAGLAAHGVRVVDAPVSGGVPRAVTGELALMVGGDDADVARVQPVLRVLGDPARQFRTGALGTGHAMKALNNVIGAATYCATAEAVLAGARFGLDPKVMIDIINASTGRSFNSVSVWGENVLTGAYATGFALGLMAKDVRIAQSVIAAAAADAPVLALAHERWAAALGELGPAADQSRAHQAWWADKLAPGSAGDQ